MTRWGFRFGWMALGIGALYGFSALAGVVSGGSLDPPGSPDSTMQTLEHIPGVWDRVLDSTNGGGGGCDSTRFECVFLMAVCNPTCHFETKGVLDHETGLVWQRDVGLFVQGYTQSQASTNCIGLSLGDRRGWRLPTAAELETLLGPSTALPAGHPFQNVPSGAFGVGFWSSSAVPGGGGNGYVGVLNSAGDAVFESVPSAFYDAWCVRAAE
ncbi:MAG: DUF1566 domain-containing protein [Chloroflexi bacterium]|nr:DUF1566 domain-containing protein [Chloroflexota bacterium]